MDEIKEFCNEIQDVKYFSNNKAALECLGVKYKIFGTRSAAGDAALKAAQDDAWIDAWYAARDAARCAAWDVARYAAWGAAQDAAWYAAWDAAWRAARNAAWYAAWDAAWRAAWDVAWNAAWDAALQCCMTTVCKDLDIPQEHRDYASQTWEIWKAGYGVLGKVEDVFYIYEKP